MRILLGAAAVALALSSGVATAQTATDTTSQTTTTMAPPPVTPPPPGTLATEHESRRVDAYGNQTDSKSTSYRDSNGVAEDTKTTTTMAPPPPPPTTTTTTTESTSTEPH